jgi:tetratricopeptide (TPR) repeat protein
VLTLTLVDAEQSHQIDTRIVRGERTNTIALRDGAVRQIANMLDLRIQPKHVGSPQAVGDMRLGAEQFYTSGLGHLQRSYDTANIESAIEQFQRAIDLDDSYALAHAGLCEAQLRLYERTSAPGAIHRAKANCESALRLNDQLPEVLIALGNVQIAAGEYPDAIKTFDGALALDAANADAMLGLARSYGFTGRNAEAVATYERNIRLRSADWRSYHELGRFYFRLGNFEAALEPFRRVMELTPGSALGLLNVGATLHSLGRIEEARDLYERSLTIERRPTALANLCQLHYFQGRYSDAEALCLEAVELNGGDPAAWANLADVYDAMSDERFRDAYLRAASLAEEALQRNPEHWDLRSRLAHYYAGAGDAEKAWENLSQALTDNPVRTMTADDFLVFAETCARIGRHDDALDWTRRARGAGATVEEVQKRRWLRPLMDKTDEERERTTP